MRAGTDIGYCDSDYRENNTMNNFPYCEEDIIAHLRKLEFYVNAVELREEKMDLYLEDNETLISYNFYDLEYYLYEEFTRKDFLREYDERFTPCYDENKYEDERN
tara:strand:- start:393 stop:707 length:315 start_codon:yes stop_codon:yes gene_type:complete